MIYCARKFCEVVCMSIRSRNLLFLCLIITFLWATSLDKTNGAEVNGTSLLDHAMASKVDNLANENTNRSNEFFVEDTQAYSWLRLGNVRPGTIEWIWFSPDKNVYRSNLYNITTTNNTLDAFDSLPIAGHDAASLPGDWHVDVFLFGKQILTERFTINNDDFSAGTNGSFTSGIDIGNETNGSFTKDIGP